jgi:hypothetical protein
MNVFEWQRYRRDEIAAGRSDPGPSPQSATPAIAPPAAPSIDFAKKGPPLTPEVEARRSAKLAELLRNR